jgi:hypothetical protein
MTKAQQRALDWLRKQGGDGVFDKARVLVAAGERLASDSLDAADGKLQEGFMYATWLALEKAGKVVFYGGKHGRGRVRVVEAGIALATRAPAREPAVTQ